MSRTHYTTDVPTEPGWYWWRKDPVGYGTIRKVVAWQGGLAVYSRRRFGGHLAVEEIGGEWSGPIQFGEPGNEVAAELASCVIFALNSFENKPIFDHKTKKMEGWHQWFRRSLEDAGYSVGLQEVADEHQS